VQHEGGCSGGIYRPSELGVVVANQPNRPGDVSAEAWLVLEPSKQRDVLAWLSSDVPCYDPPQSHRQVAADALGAIAAADAERDHDHDSAAPLSDAGDEVLELRVQLRQLTRQLAELAGEDPDAEHETDDLVVAIEHQLALADKFAEQRREARARVATLYPGLCSVADLDPRAGCTDEHLAEAAHRRVDGLIAEVIRLTPWAELTQQLWTALEPWEGTHLIGACKALAIGPADAWRDLGKFLEQLGAMSGPTSPGHPQDGPEGSG
jgi:hypothetical protein